MNTESEVIDVEPDSVTTTPVNNIVAVQPSEIESDQSMMPISPLDLPTEVFQKALDRRRDNHAVLKKWIRQSLVEKQDFGIIPTKRGPSKPSLWKSGAEKIIGLLNITAHFPSLVDIEQSVLNGNVPDYIMVRCELHNSQGIVLAEGSGARKLSQDYNDLNKSLKMAEKSALINCVLKVGGLSDVFTQDLEDLTEVPPATKPVRTQPKPNAEVAVISDEQLAVLTRRIQQLKLDRQRVESWIQRAWDTTLDHLPANRFPTLYKQLDKWATQTQTAA
jgi:hypothetical protein